MHPNIVGAHDADEADGTHFLVMEYVEGKDLSALATERGPFPLAQAVACIRQAAQGMTVEADRVIVDVDAKRITDYRDPERRFTSGHVALQLHSGDNRVEFRKIEIQELPAPK